MNRRSFLGDYSLWLACDLTVGHLMRLSRKYDIPYSMETGMKNNSMMLQIYFLMI